MDKFWLWLARFAVKRLTLKYGALIPDGIPTIRDREARCWAYEPRKKKLVDFDCHGDGHYLCKECCHFKVAFAEP